MRSGEATRLRWAIGASLLVHAGGIALLWLAVAQAEEMPAMRVYAVDIVSPPPQLEGEPNPGGGGAPVTEEEAPEPEPEAEAEPEAPAVQPEPSPPAPETPPQREPSPPAQATRTAEPEKAAPKPAEAAAEEPPAPRTGGGSGEGTGASRGAEPEPSSAGGEDIDVHLRGVQCPSPAYCANIVRVLDRYFRPPTGASGDAVEVFFWINRDGSAGEMRVVRSSGSYPFQIAALEAVEQAGKNKEFGPLPRSFQLDRLPVSFSFLPDR